MYIKYGDKKIKVSPIDETDTPWGARYGTYVDDLGRYYFDATDDGSETYMSTIQTREGAMEDLKDYIAEFEKEIEDENYDVH